MKKDSYDHHLEAAIGQLRKKEDVGDLRDFERSVWTEIALHDERWTIRMVRFFCEALPTVPAPAVAGSVAMAIVAGVLTALTQAEAYGDSVSDTMEAQYVASIHPVLRSQSEEHQHDPTSP